jgi:hypothetical protein
MSNTAITTAGSTLEVANELPASYDQVGFSALQYTPIGEITNLGEFGREYTLVTHNPIADRRTRKRKGSYNEGSMSLEMAKVTSDEGQALLLAGVDIDASHSFKLTLQDGTIIYFTAQIMSFMTSLGDVDSITSVSCTVEIDSGIVEVAPV